MFAKIKKLIKNTTIHLKTGAQWEKDYLLAKKACEDGNIQTFEKYYHPENKKINLMEMLYITVEFKNKEVFEYLAKKQETFEKLFERNDELLDSLNFVVGEKNATPLRMNFFNLTSFLIKTIQNKEDYYFKYVLENHPLTHDLQFLPKLKRCLEVAIGLDEKEMVKSILKNENFCINPQIDMNFKIDLFKYAVFSRSSDTLDFLVNEYELTENFWKRWDDLIEVPEGMKKSLLNPQDIKSLEDFKDDMAKRKIFLDLGNQLNIKDEKKIKLKI